MKKTKDRTKKQAFWKTLWPYMREHKGKLLFCTTCALVVGVFVAVQPLVIKYIVDNGIANNALSSREKIRLVGWLCLLYIALSFGRILVFEDGKIIEEGNYEQLAAKEGGAFAKLLKFNQ